MTKPPAPEHPDSPQHREGQAASGDPVETVVARAGAGGEVYFSQDEDVPEAGAQAVEKDTFVGRPAPTFIPPAPTLPPPSGEDAEEPYRNGFLTFLRLFGGWALLLGLAYVMWTPGEWPNDLLLWTLLVVLADEFGGWFGYLGVALGGLGYVSPNPPPAEWLIILPLVGGALTALLLVKHSGGPFVLPFAGALYAGTLLAVARFGTKFDPEMKLPSNDTFLRSALLAVAVGLGFSFVRQLIGLYLRRRAARSRSAAPTSTSVA
ncbi:hypothetical protein [Deinococcus aerophilus]|uniref:Uncharacterized protein n=1 Tax=Deinococcus aerophilus TaxID=522488 RepID=A0ABQ2GNR3_9DEIO|nr:hypothetical protein [Deinococcus aerophilus]GGM04967.1 hypothetical protein GCM10010841_11810 [Deinococcus aerophilus]